MDSIRASSCEVTDSEKKKKGMPLSLPGNQS